MTKLEEMMEAHEDAIKMSKEWDCLYDEAFRKVWDCVWYDDEGEVRDRPSERKARTLLTPGVCETSGASERTPSLETCCAPDC